MKRAILLLFVAGALGAAHASKTPPAKPPAAVPSMASIDSMLAGNRYEEAERASREAIAALEAGRAPDSLRAAAWDRLTRALLGAGRWNDPKAVETAREAVRLKESAFGPRHGEVATSLITLGWMLYRGGSWEEAGPIAERALDVSEGFHGPRHRSVVRSLHLLAGIVEEAGEFARAESLYRGELDLSISLWGEESVEAANTMNSLAVLYRKTGRFAEARPLYERALAAREKALGPDHVDVSWSLNNYANLLGNMGDWPRALELYERALQIRRARNGPDHPAVALGYNNLGTALSAVGDTARAEDAFRMALATQARALAPDHPDRAMTLQNLGLLCTGRRRFSEADTSLARALEIREKRFGRKSLPVAATLAARGELSVARGSAGDALPLFEEALSIAEDLEVSESELMAELLLGYTQALSAAGRDSAAFETALRAQTLTVRRIRMTARVLDERAALKYRGTRGDALGSVLSLLASRSRDASRARRAFDALIASRTLVLDELAARHRAVRSTDDAEVARLREELGRARENLAHLVVIGTGSSVERHRARIQAAIRRREQAEAGLAERSIPFREEAAREQAGFDAVARSLDDGDALIAFVRYRPAGSTPQADRYGAFVQRGGSSAEPRWIALGDAARVDAAVQGWLDEASRRPGALSRAVDERRCRERGEALRKLVWDPVAAWLSGSRRVFVVPDGVLHEINLSALPLKGGRYLAEGSAPIHLLVTERDLLPVGSPGTGRGILAMGAPDYERAEVETDARVASVVPATESRSRESPAPRPGSASACPGLARLRFDPLPSTQLELESVMSVWSERRSNHSSEPVLSLSGAEATERVVKGAAPGRRILHLATHGFFMSAGCTPERASGANIEPVLENPLLRCGVALAGANRRAGAAVGSEDGMLTAEEASAIDLSGVEWVVLSACESGRGELWRHEGAVGLRRAFQVSGARTVIMSLWAVDDRSTAEWMRSLYRERFLRSRSTIDAVRGAHRSALAERRAHGLSDHPFYWAAFVAAGDWR